MFFGTENTATNKSDKYSFSCEAYILVGKWYYKQVNNYNTVCKRMICETYKKKTKQSRKKIQEEKGNGGQQWNLDWVTVEGLPKRRHLIKNLKEVRGQAIPISEGRQFRQRKQQVQKPGGRACFECATNT